MGEGIERIHRELAAYGDLCAATVEDIMAGWDPNRHPRDADGQFTSTGDRIAARLATTPDPDLSTGTHRIDGVSLVTSRREDVVTLHMIRNDSQTPGQGRARAALQLLLDQADRDGLTVALTPAPREGDRQTKKTRLTAWYRSMGFIKKPRSEFGINNTMIRYPQSRSVIL